MPTCVVKRCSNSDKTVSKNKDGVSFFRLPAEPIRKEIWCRIIRKERGDPHFKPNNFHRVCSAHFTEECFTVTKAGIRKLKKTAIPHLSIPDDGKIFNADVEAEMSKEFIESAIQTTSNCDYGPTITETSNNDNSNKTTVKENSEEELTDMDISDLQSIFDSPIVVHFKKSLKRLQNRNRLICKKLKNLQRQNARLMKKNESLTNIINELKNY